VKGTIVGSYRIIDTVSVGGMGTVYRAEHTLIGRLAAVKILHPELCANRDIVNRFFNEARATSSIKHPGIVEVFDFGYMASGHAYLVMEFLEGMPLSHRVKRRGSLLEAEAALLLRSVCIALSAAHDKGVVHRDLKPDNIFVMPDPDSVFGERTKILDFGIAKLMDIGPAGSATKTGAVMGTPTYMSPEQCSGRGEVDARADLYSIGCMLYELVTGRPPFVRSGAGELIGSHLFLDPEPPSTHVAGLSAETEALIMMLLAKRPERRVQTAKDLAHRLALIAQQHGWMALGEISRPSLGPIAAVAPPLATPVEQTTSRFPPPEAAALDAQLPTTVTPPPTTTPTPPPAAQKPTTLSGAASQLDLAPRRRGLRIAIAAGLVAAAAGFAAVFTLGPRWRSAGSAAAASSTTAAPQPQGTEPAPAPAAITAADAAPAPTAEPPTPTDPPKPTADPPKPTADPPKPTADPPKPTADAPKPTADPPKPTADGPKPGTDAAAAAAPHPAAAVKPPPPKPVAKPLRKPRRPDAGSAKEPKDLLEQDI
jgi:eukaryotic-like serine/threonine-protein kinase